MDKKVRLLAVIDHLGGGGAEHQFLELVRRLDRERFELRVFLTAGGGQRLADARAAGLDVVCHWEEMRRDTPKALGLLYAEIRAFRPQVIMSWLSYSITLTAAAALLAGHGRLLFSERSSLEHMFNHEVRFGALKKFIFKRAFRRGSLVVTNSRIVAGEFGSRGYAAPGRIRVIQNGVDLRRFDALPPKRELRRSLGLDGDAIYGIYAGKIEERKGIGYLMAALREMPGRAFRFLAIGDGSMEGVLQGFGGIEFLGYRRNAAEYIKASDFLVLPSLYEGLPNVILEAMAVGTAVVSTRASGIPEIIEDGVSGLLVPPGDAVALRAAIARTAGDAGLRAALAARARRTVERLSMERMVESFSSLIIELSGAGRG